VIVSQDRGYREGYARADLAGHHGHHDWKTGVDSIFSPVHEALQYAITDPTQFDPGTQLNFQFRSAEMGRRAFDLRAGSDAPGPVERQRGLRFDHYRFVVHESAWSPRIGVSRFVPALNLLLHASYDRVFQRPPLKICFSRVRRFSMPSALRCCDCR